MKHSKKGSGNFMHDVSEFIVDKRQFIFIVVIALMIFSAFSVSWVEVESDLTSFLPDKSDSKAGVEIMFDEFTLYGSAQIMVANISIEKAKEISSLIQDIEGVSIVDFAEDKAHYNNASACYTVNLEYAQNDARSEEVLATIKDALSDYDTYISSDIGNPMNAILDKEIGVIIVVASIIITQTSARSTAIYARRTLYFSIASSILLFLLIPAVSINTNLPLSFSTTVSTASRVVPAMSETITLSSPAILFTREDFPAFGFPITATLI